MSFELCDVESSKGLGSLWTLVVVWLTLVTMTTQGIYRGGRTFNILRFKTFGWYRLDKLVGWRRVGRWWGVLWRDVGSSAAVGARVGWRALVESLCGDDWRE